MRPSPLGRFQIDVLATAEATLAAIQEHLPEIRRTTWSELHHRLTSAERPHVILTSTCAIERKQILRLRREHSAGRLPPLAVYLASPAADHLQRAWILAPLGAPLLTADIDLSEAVRKLGCRAPAQDLLSEVLRIFPHAPDLAVSALEHLAETRAYGPGPVGSLAQRLHVSRPVLSRAFRNAGMPGPKQFHSLFQLSAATESLRSRVKASTCARAAGFSSARSLRAALASLQTTTTAARAAPDSLWLFRRWCAVNLPQRRQG